jgi:hypothetical protein
VKAHDENAIMIPPNLWTPSHKRIVRREFNVDGFFISITLELKQYPEEENEEHFKGENM